MLGSLEMTRDAFVSAVTRKDPGDYTLNVVVVRLLAIALTVSRWRTNPVRSEGLPVPKHYRTWPLIESDVDVSGVSRYLRFAVCPKAVSVPDEDTFPVGTTLVVETFSSAPETGGQLRLVYVMEKVSSLDHQAMGRRSREGWAYATYDAVGRVVASDALDSGVCRLPVM
ncbi:MAG: cytochrome P460 family protein [Nitrospiraceae bacterium]|nr:cytochrome P460 family protein [Nitrospiraceae bacterium]